VELFGTDITQHVGVFDLIQHEKIGYVVRKRDVEDVVKGIRQFLEQTDEVREWRHVARESVSKEFTLYPQVRCRLDVYVKNLEETEGGVVVDER
jgi:hypothetical protein